MEEYALLTSVGPLRFEENVSTIKDRPLESATKAN
jgi:hypothetical protein